MKPRRIQRRRAKGWRMPANTVYVGRPSKWGNPYALESYRFVDAHGRRRSDPDAAREMALRDFRLWLDVTRGGHRMYQAAVKELRGKNLACWCRRDQPCHADMLLEIANG